MRAQHPTRRALPWALAVACAEVAFAQGAAPAAQPAQSASGASPALVVLDVDDTATAGGKPLKMSVREVQRQPDHSVVEVVFVSGASVPSSLFVLKGMCTVLKSRGERLFRAEQIASAPTTYRVTFPRRASESALRGPEKQVFSDEDCGRLGF